VLVLCGDLTDYGLAEEARVLVKELAAVKTMPVVAVLGNHDYESNETDQVKGLLVDAGVHLLDGEACEIDGVGFAGAKGLGGGFGERALQPWGEEVIKRFSAGDHRRGPQARVGAREAANGPAHRPPALLAHSGDGGG